MKKLADTVNYLLNLFIFFKVFLPVIITAVFLVLFVLVWIFGDPLFTKSSEFYVGGGATGGVGQ